VRKIIIILMFLFSSFFFFACKESASKAVPALVFQLSSKESGERNRAALRLASYGKEAAPAVPALIKLLSDKNPGVRTSAAYALRQVDTPEARKALDGYQK
jgi:HEAT repeat protein